MIDHHWFQVQLPALLKSASRWEGDEKPSWLQIELPSLLRSAAKLLEAPSEKAPSKE